MAFPEQNVQHCMNLAMDFALSHGLIIRDKLAQPPSPASVVHAPFALCPSPFPKEGFEKAYALQPLFNQLVEAVANNQDFLVESLTDVGKLDEFTGRLLKIFLLVSRQANRQTIRLGIHRSDYMQDTVTSEIKQVELNTISSSFSSLSALVTQLHKYVYDGETSELPAVSSPLILPPNESLDSVAKGLHSAWALYGSKSAVIIMVVQPNEGNIFDQRWIEYQLNLKYHVPLVRATLLELNNNCVLKGDEKRLFYKSKEVAVVYFRAGYTPVDYPTEDEWIARTLIEESFAVKCPCIEYHLAGTKKIQQILALPGVLEKFIPEKRHQEFLRSSFTELYPLDKSEIGLRAFKLGLETPESFVLKPQREGGGNNFYGNDIKKKLETLSADERNSFILMSLIKPPSLRNNLIRRGVLNNEEVVSELGVYGIWLSDGPIVHLNTSGGHLLRTKTSNSNEGGVAAGYAVLDSPYLI